MEWEKRDENSKTDQQQQINVALRVRRDLSDLGRSLHQVAHVETAKRNGKTLVKQDQTQQQNETPDCQIDRDLPCGPDTISASPNPDQQKRRNQRQFMERVEEKQIDGGKRADRPSANE